MTNPALVATKMAIERMSNDVIAVSGNALLGFGKLGPANLAFEPMKEAGLHE